MSVSLRYDITAWLLAGLALIAILKLSLLAALLAGLLVFELVHIVALRLKMVGVTHETGKAMALGLLAAVTIVALSFAIVGLVAVLGSGKSDNLVALLQKMAEVIETARVHFPPWLQNYVPSNAQELELAASNWLRGHVSVVQRVGENFGKVLAHILIGMIIGGLIALGDTSLDRSLRPLTRALTERASILGTAFRRVVFAQVRISALNTTLTALYLVVFLPMIGIHLPLMKTVIAVTFIAGLLPVIGNLISNTVIVIVSLSVSPYAAVGSLIFLVVIHKLEYFINARIIGTRIRARAWELLLAMLVMDAAFGIAGVIAAPIYYAYLKDELATRKLI